MNLRTRIGILVFALTTPLLFHLPAAAAEFQGPFTVGNQFPLFLHVDQPGFESAKTGNSIAVSLTHSSVFMMKDSAVWSVHLDTELTELSLRYRTMIPGGFEAGIETSFIRPTEGFLDSPLAWYHRTFGFGDYGRSTRPDNTYLFDVRMNGVQVVRTERDKAGIGDTRLSLRKEVVSGKSVVTVRADVELPTGDAKQGYGNGSVDAGIALIAEAPLSADAKWYATIGGVLPGDVKGYVTVDLKPYAYAATAIEYRAFESVSLIGQVSATTSPYPTTDISVIDTPALILLLGGRYYGTTGNYDLSLTEDLNVSGAPDFALDLTYKKNW